MRANLDTHVLLWWIADDPRLSNTAREILSDAGNVLFVSAASGWETAIKAQIGKLALQDPPETFVPAQIAVNGFDELPIRMAHVLHVHALPLHHRDPFDRILVAQSRVENLPLLTADALIAQYAVQVVW